MKTKFRLFGLLFLAFVSFGNVACSSDDDGTTESVKTEPKVEITASDDVIGAKQQVILSVNYNTDNPNILVTWYEDGEKLNSIPRSELSCYWYAAKVGEHHIEVAITDREQVLKYQKTFTVVDTELAGAIIGDSKSKIARTFGVNENDVITVKESSSVNNKYYFSNNKLYRIESIRSVSLTPKTKTDYMQPVTYFANYFNIYKEKYGDPIRENYTHLETSESKIIEYGGHILSGGMEISAIFQSDTRNAEIQIGPYTKNGYGFTFYQTLSAR